MTQIIITMAPKSKSAANAAIAATAVNSANAAAASKEFIKNWENSKKSKLSITSSSDEDDEVPAPAVIKPSKLSKPAKVYHSDDEKKPDKIKRTRKPSNYNMLLGEFMKQVSVTENEKANKEDRLSRGDRMKAAQQMYRDWKIKQTDIAKIKA